MVCWFDLSFLDVVDSGNVVIIDVFAVLMVTGYLLGVIVIVVVDVVVGASVYAVVGKFRHSIYDSTKKKKNMTKSFMKNKRCLKL